MFSRHSYIIIIIILALFLRFYGATIPFFIDDDTDWILFANNISFNSHKLCLLPFGSGHGPLTAYLVKLSGLLFGENAFGWRMFSIIFGTLIIPIIYFLTKEGLGKKAAVFAAYLSSVNVLFIFFSRYATEDIYNLFFFPLSLLFFWRALSRNNNFYMLLTGVALGFGLLTKESTTLLFPVFLIFILCIKKFRVWFKRKELYLSICIAILISSPYLYWLFTHKLYFFLPEVKEIGQWFNFLNFPSSTVYLFLGKPDFLFNKDFALGHHYIGPAIGLICIAGVIYSLRYYKNEFIFLMNLVFWIIVFCEVLFFKGIPRHFIIILTPAFILASFLLSNLWKRNILNKCIILATLFYLLIYSVSFTLKLDKYYALHSQIVLPFIKEKYIKVDLNYLAKEFIEKTSPFSPTLIVFPDPELDPVDNFVNGYSKLKTLGTSPENRFLPYNKKDFQKIVILTLFDENLIKYKKWVEKNSFGFSQTEGKIFLTNGYSFPIKMMILYRSNIDQLSLKEIESFVNLSMP